MDGCQVRVNSKEEMVILQPQPPAQPPSSFEQLRSLISVWGPSLVGLHLWTSFLLIHPANTCQSLTLSQKWC